MNKSRFQTASASKVPDRLGYLLHLWNCAGQWRASLEDPGSGERLGFENLEQLFAHLMDLTEGTLNRPEQAEAEQIDGNNTGTTSCGC